MNPKTGPRIWPKNGVFRHPRLDLPAIEPVIVEVPDEEGPFGARGIGEPPILAFAPAVANAIYDAVGVRIMSLPITAEKVLEALETKRRGG